MIDVDSCYLHMIITVILKNKIFVAVFNQILNVEPLNSCIKMKNVFLSYINNAFDQVLISCFDIVDFGSMFGRNR